MRNIDKDELRRTRDRMLVATKIADSLNARGISQKKFAKMIGRSEPEISEWLSGNRNFTIDTLSDIKKCLGLDILNTQSMRMTPVPESISRIKMTKKRYPVSYNMQEMLVTDAPAVWLPASDIKNSLIL